MSLLVVGSVAYDSIKSPAGEKERCLGGSATYFALAASFFTEVRVVAVVGEDFRQADEEVLTRRGIDSSGIQREKGKTFFWSGEYGDNLNEAKTRTTELNVFQNFNPQVPEDFKQSAYLFLANIDPVLQLQVRQQVHGARLVGGDTMNFWINGKPRELEAALRHMDMLLINDAEAKAMGGTPSLPRAAQRILAKGPRVVVIKHGEYGATAFFREGGLHPFRAPALPIEEVLDPTGAGDCFAGGFMGYLASQDVFNREVLKRAMFYGGVMGSFAVEKFGTQRLQELSKEEIEGRFQMFRELSHLD